MIEKDKVITPTIEYIFEYAERVIYGLQCFSYIKCLIFCSIIINIIKLKKIKIKNIKITTQVLLFPFHISSILHKTERTSFSKLITPNPIQISCYIQLLGWKFFYPKSLYKFKQPKLLVKKHLSYLCPKSECWNKIWSPETCIAIMVNSLNKLIDGRDGLNKQAVK